MARMRSAAAATAPKMPATIVPSPVREEVLLAAIEAEGHMVLAGTILMTVVEN
jgi:hypothetical protein